MEKPIKGRKYTDADGNVWTCVNLDETHGLFTMERRYEEPGDPGFCKSYEVVEREPLPLAWFAGRYTEAP